MPIKQSANLMDLATLFRSHSSSSKQSRRESFQPPAKFTFFEVMAPSRGLFPLAEVKIRQSPSAPKTPSKAESKSGLAWVSAIDQTHCLNGLSYLRAKRTLDLVLVIGSVPIWLPTLLLCYVVVKLEQPSVPAVFAQKRTGQGGVLFRMFKFRTMVPNAAELKQQLMHLNELKPPDFKIKNDPRITRVGRILRKTSLDELPQLINVLMGEMSLVGPRPTSFSRETYQLWQTERLDVIPGLTGLWQIYGRAQSEFDDRLRLDILYIRSRSIALDLRLIFKTFTSILAQRGAY